MTIDYTVNQHIALLLVARDRITVRGSRPCRRDGGHLSAGVCAALVKLEQDGLVTPRNEQIDSNKHSAQTLLTVSGVQRLTRFDQEYGRPSREAAFIEEFAESLGVG